MTREIKNRFYQDEKVKQQTGGKQTLSDEFFESNNSGEQVQVVEKNLLDALKKAAVVGPSLVIFVMSISIYMGRRSPFASNEQVPGSPHSDAQQPQERYESKTQALRRSVEGNPDCIQLTLEEKISLDHIRSFLESTDEKNNELGYTLLKTQFPHKQFEVTVRQNYIDSILNERIQNNLFQCLTKITAASKSLTNYKKYKDAINHLMDPDNTISYENVEMINVESKKLNESQLAWLTYFTNLKLLNLKGQGYSSLPSSLSGLSKLKNVDLSDNNFEQFPSFLQDLMEIEFLNLGYNKLRSVPKTIGDLTLLKSLILNGNENLTELPLTMKNLKNLEVLLLDGSPISFDSLKKVIGGMISLKKLYIHNGAFSKQQIKTLEEIAQNNNPGFTIRY